MRARLILGALLLAAVVGFAQSDGTTRLHLAVQANQQEAVAALLAKGADAKAANRYGITPLWLAATNGSVAITRLLLKAGADATVAMPNGETALMTAARTGEPETVKLLIQAGANPNAQETSQGESALMWAAAENHPEAIRALIAGGANPNLHAKSLDLAPMKWMQVGMVDTLLPRGGFAAVIYAARQDAQAAVRALAEGKADLDARDADGATALQLAIINQHYDMAALLMDLGANPNVADNTGMTAIYAAVDMIGFRSDIGRPARPSQDKLTAMDVLRSALQHGGDANAQLHTPIIGRHHGFPDGTLGEGATALMRAAKTPDPDAMQLLLDAGAKPTLGMKNGSSALLILAATRVGPGPNGVAKLETAFRMLAKHGVDLNQANAKGETALITAAKQGSNEIVRLLAGLGADLDAKDSTGKTALDLVTPPSRSAHEDTAAILRDLAAKSAKP